MNRKHFIAVAVAMMVLFAVTAVYAAPRVYVRNQPIGNGVPSRGKIYVDLQRFLQAAGFSYEMKDTTLEIRKTGGAGGQVGAIPTRYHYDGRYINAHTINISGRPYVMAEPVASALGMAQRYSQEADVYDYFYTNDIPPVRDGKTPVKPDAGKSDKDEPGKTSSEKQEMVSFKGAASELDKDCLIVPKNDYFYDFNSKELRGNVHFVNTYDKDPLTKVSVVFKVVVGEERSAVWSNRYNIGEMKPGTRTQKYEYYFINPSGVQINDSNFYYEIEYLEPVKE